MNIEELQKNWNELGNVDPLWAISTLDDKRGNRWDREEFFATGRADVAALMTMLSSLGITPVRGRALDFGCGVGRLTRALAAHFDEVCGVDIAPSMIAQAREHIRPGERCQFHVNAAGHLRELFANDSFDFVLSKSVLQHMRPQFAANYIRELLRVLVPGTGVCAFQEHSHPLQIGQRIQAWAREMVPPSATAVYRSMFKRQRSEPIMELYGMSRRRVTAIVEKAGGQVIDVRADPSGSGSWATFLYTVRKR